MNIGALLNSNDDAGADSRRASEPASAQAKRPPPPPPLTTSRSHASAGYPLSAGPYSDRLSSAASFTAGTPLASHSASSHTPTPHSGAPTSVPSPYHRNAPLPSPGARTHVSTPGSYYAPAHRPASNHSAGRTSSSPYTSTTPGPVAVASPTLGRNNSFHQVIASPQPPHPNTPLAPPPIPRTDSFADPAGYPHHRSSLVASPHASQRASLSSARSLSYSTSEALPNQHIAQDQVNGSPGNRRTSYHSSPAQRQQSLSVSPKTVVQPLPITHAHQQQFEQQQSPTQQNHVPHRQSLAPPSAPLSKIVETNEHSSLQAPPGPKKRTETPPAMGQKSSKVAGVKRTAPEEQPAETQVKKPRTAPEEQPAEEAAVKKPRPIAEPPIWAQPKRGLKPMMIRGQTNGAPAQASAQTSAHAPALKRAATGALAQGFEPSIQGTIPYEDVTRQIANFIFQYVFKVPGDAPFEIEAKVGVLCDPATRNRIRLPVRSETIVDHDFPFVFTSQMDEKYHRVMNNYLNGCLVESKRPGSTSRVPMEYMHLKEIDEFYEMTTEEAGAYNSSAKSYAGTWQGSYRHPRVRVTRDERTGEVKAKIVKSRLADMEVYCPNQAFDFRISINLEQPYMGKIDSLERSADPPRNKDRLSYTHQWCRMDLTQVRGTPGARPTHELEVELEMGRLREEGRLAIAQDPGSKYEDLIKVFLDNVRVLARYAPG